MPVTGGQAPARLGRYELLARLATGGMGEIFLARLEGAAGFEKLVVVKRILPHLADDARFRQMLIAEARIASKMSHSNICQVYELGETDGQLYIVMEYLEGVTLLPLLRKASKDAQPLDYGFVAGVIQQTCDALHYAHELQDRTGENLGIVHRDVNPSNLFLTDSGITKVLDFGIAKVKDASANTQTGTVKGKYAYMAPEQLRGGAVDRRVDVFALGVSLYEMLALRRLFQRNTDYLTFRAVMEQPIPDLRRYRPDAPDALVDAIMHALERDPANRFDTARQFGTAVLDALAAIKRPWSQGELGDFVRGSFAGELGKRSQAVMAAVHRQTDSATGRSTMPLIAMPVEQTEETYADNGDDDDGFPSVETEVSDMSEELRVVARGSMNPGDFVGHTPPPFATETTPSAAVIEPLRTGQGIPPLQPLSTTTQALPAMGGRRSLVWPALAMAMVGVAAGALYLVWQQSQRAVQQQVVVVGQAGDASVAAHPVDPGPGSGSAAVLPAVIDASTPPTPGSGSGGARPVDPPTQPPQPNQSQLALHRAFEHAKGKLNECLLDAGAERDAIPRKLAVKIAIADDGKLTGVEFEPAPVGKLRVGGCMRGVLLMIGTIPHWSEDAQTVTLSLNVKAG